MQILVTGAAGLIGGELVAKLIAGNHSVIGLIRSNGEVRSNDGVLLPAKPFAQDLPRSGELLTVKGDMTAPACGLPSEFVDNLSPNIDMIIHCAATTAFDAAPDVYNAINVQGTENIQNLVPDARFLHVSTAYTCGSQDGPVSETLHSPNTNFMNGYEESKSRAEAYVVGSGQNVVIARPSIVVGEHQTGQIKAFDTIYAVFRLIAEGLISSIPTGPHATLDFVPIDHVIGGLMDIVNHWDSAKGSIFHLTSAGPVTPRMLVDAIGSFDQLQQPELVPASQFAPDDLPPRQRRLYKRTASHYASYFDRNPRFVTDNLERLSGRACPPITLAALQRMIKYCIDAGFLGSR